MNQKTRGLSDVPGFKYSAVKCGIRYEDRLDYAIIIADNPCNCAAVFTQNNVKAAPVKLSMERIDNPIKAILVNATNANACTGDAGMNSALTLTADMAQKLSIPESSILMASTGIIGHQLPVDKMLGAHQSMIDSLSTNNGTMVAKAIMTTDTIKKEYAVSFTTPSGTYTVAGTAKGSGMIAPNMATLLSFIVTDAPIEKTRLSSIFKNTINKTLNSITIDGDMSTNDTAIILAPIADTMLSGTEDIENFEKALHEVLSSLSIMVVGDGEGTTKAVTIKIQGALSDNDATKAARSISESLLVKTALFGNDPNWGRIAAAAGYSGAEMEEDKLSIYYEDIPLFLKGKPIEPVDKTIGKVVSEKYFTITIEFGLGDSCAEMITSDISFDYVKINAEYST